METPLKSESHPTIKAEDIKMEANAGMKKLTIERTLKLDKANKELEITTTMKKVNAQPAGRRTRPMSAARKSSATKQVKADDKLQQSKNPSEEKAGSANAGADSSSIAKGAKNTGKTSLTGAKRLRAEVSDKRDNSASVPKMKKRPLSPATAKKAGSKLTKKRAAKANGKNGAGPSREEQILMKEFQQFLGSCSADQRN